MFSYSIAIRTLGTAGEKYQKLLNSIKALAPKPEKVIVVLPEGYELPKEKLGFEEFVFSPKSMIIQRLAAINYISSDYILFCDDDVEFPSDFVRKLVKPLLTGEYACSSGPLLEFFPPAGMKYMLASVLGGACVMLHGRENKYVRILNTGGWSYNRSIKVDEHKIYDTDSLAWTCFLISKKAMQRIVFEDELWAEKRGYAAFEDRAMFYKLKLNGYKTCVVSDANYIHNDAKTSTKELKLTPVFCRAFNHYIFWHRFLFSSTKFPLLKLWRKICIEYYICMQWLYTLKNKEIHEASLKGFYEAKQFIQSVEYKELPSIYKRG